MKNIACNADSDREHNRNLELQRTVDQLREEQSTSRSMYQRNLFLIEKQRKDLEQKNIVSNKDVDMERNRNLELQKTIDRISRELSDLKSTSRKELQSLERCKRELELKDKAENDGLSRMRFQSDKLRVYESRMGNMAALLGSIYGKPCRWVSLNNLSYAMISIQ